MPTPAEWMALPEASGGPVVGNTLPSADLWLAPRLVPPARIHFRWLSAASGAQESNTHPNQTPVCGWLLANHLDNSLSVYDTDGNPMGVIDQEARWREVPGTNVALGMEDLLNPTLRKVVERLALGMEEADPGEVKKAFLQDFISVTDQALENIDPESFVHHQELALLMGRPIAVVRTAVKLELQSGSPIHHGWTEFRQDLRRNTRETDDLEKVKFPIRIGDRGQLNDGVLGFWKEGTEQELNAVFQTTVAPGLVSNAGISSYDETPLYLNHSLEDPTETLTLLIDPRCEVHITTGIVPVKKSQIPREQYAPALQKLSITFLSAPLLTGVDQVGIPCPMNWVMNGPGWKRTGLAGRKSVAREPFGKIRCSITLTMATKFGRQCSTKDGLLL